MNRFRLLWMTLLMFVVSLPSVLAQGLISSRWITLGVNTLIIWVVFFVLLSVMMQNKDAKEKSMMWLVALIIAGIIAWNFANTGLIWKSGVFAKFFNIKVLVNTAAISGLIYTVLRAVGVATPEGKEGQTGMWALVVFFAALFALQLNTYFWELATIKGLLAYFFNPTDGVFTGKRIFVFFVSFFVFAWGLVGYLKMDGENKKISYLIALILAAESAKAGIGTEYVTVVGQIFAVLIFSRTIGEHQNKAVAFIIACIIVGGISSLVFPDSGAWDIAKQRVIDPAREAYEDHEANSGTPESSGSPTENSKTIDLFGIKIGVIVGGLIIGISIAWIFHAVLLRTKPQKWTWWSFVLICAVAWIVTWWQL